MAIMACEQWNDRILKVCKNSTSRNIWDLQSFEIVDEMLDLQIFNILTERRPVRILERKNFGE